MPLERSLAPLSEVPKQHLFPAPISGINSHVPPHELNPQQRYAPRLTNFFPTPSGTLRKREGYSFPEFYSTNNVRTVPLDSRELRALIEFRDRVDNSISLIGVDDMNHLIIYKKRTAGGFIKETKMPTGNIFNHASTSPVSIALWPISEENTNILYLTGGEEGEIAKWSPRIESGAVNRVSGTTVSSKTVPTFVETIDSTNVGFETLKARTLLAVHGHLILGNIVEKPVGGTEVKAPYRIRWSKFANPQSFRTGADTTAGFVDLIQDDADGPIQTMHTLREFIIIYKENSIYNLSFRGGGVFFPELKSAHRGAISPRAVAPVQDGNRHLVVSSDNIYIYDGFGFKFPPIGQNVQDFFYSRLDWDKTQDIEVVSLPERYECWILFDNKNSGDREALCWNWQRNSWTHHDLHLRTMILARNFESDVNEAVFASPVVTAKKGLVRLFDGTKTDGETPSGVVGDTIEGVIEYPVQAYINRMLKYETLFQRGLAILSATPTGVYKLKVTHKNNTASAIVQEADLAPQSKSANVYLSESDRYQDHIWWFIDSINQAFKHLGLVVKASSAAESEEIYELTIQAVEGPTMEGQ